MKNLKNLHDAAGPHQKKQVLSVVADFANTKQLKQWGFFVTSRTHATAQQWARTGKPGRAVPPPPVPPSKQPISKETLELLEAFLMKHAHPSPISDKWDLEGMAEVFLLHSVTPFELHKDWCLQYPDKKMALSTFYNKIPKNISKSRTTITDYCTHCYRLLQIGRALKSNKDLVELEQEKVLLEFHRQLKNDRKALFQDQKEKLKEGEVLVVMDFKENIKLRRGPLELSKSFFNRPSRAIFGIVVWYVKEGQLCRQDNVYFSEILNKDNQFVTDCFELLRNSDFWKGLGAVNSLKLWLDNCAGHFKCGQFLSYLARLKQNKTFETVPPNFELTSSDTIEVFCTSTRKKRLRSTFWSH
jgi:hypothetical protein